MAKLELFFPLKNPSITFQKFGENLTPLYKELGMKGHNGWDIGGFDGQGCRAAHDGVVTYAGLDGSNGWLVVIRTSNKRDYLGKEVYFKTLYGHLKQGSILVSAGQSVKVGDIIAKCNTSGAATGPHLHFGLKPVQEGEADWQWFNLEQDNGYNGAIDPAPFFNGIFAEDSQVILSGYQKLIIMLKNMLENLLKRSLNK